MDQPSDPKIVARLKNIPPFDNEEPKEVPAEAPVEPAEPQEPTVEAEGEAQTEVKEEPKEEAQSERTKEQIEKLKQHNAELKKMVEEQKIPKKNALDALIPENPPSPVTNVIPTPQQYPNLAPKEIKDVFAGLTDEQGYVDTGLLKETLISLQKAKEEAEKKVAESEARVQKVERKQDDFERKQLMKEVHARYPKLNPENADSEDQDVKFDNRFYEQFQKELMYQWSTAGNADPMIVARKASDIIYGADMRKADREKADKAELAKKNINATTVKPASTLESYKDRDELIQSTRKGSHSALMERLNRIGQ